MDRPVQLSSFPAKLFKILTVAACAIGITGCQQDPQFLWSATTRQQAGLEIPVEAKINGQLAQLDFDTGTAYPVVLLSGAAKRLDLQALPGQPPFRITPSVKINIGQSEATMPLLVVDLPAGVEPGFDGLLGWPSLGQKIFVFDAEHLNARVQEKLPEEAAKWLKLPLHVDPKVWITFMIAQKSGEPNLVGIDTGDDSGGVGLSPALWHEWRAAHPDAPVTLNAVASVSGFGVGKVAWAKELSFGPLVLTDVPVYEAHLAPHYMASLGMYAVTRMNLAIDVKNASIYFNPVHTTPLPYPANRAGAVFIPRDAEHDDLVFHVLVGTPAYEAGLRNGDLLLKIGDQDVTHWRANSTDLSNSKVFGQPAGTKIELTLKRGDTSFKAIVTLRNILGAADPR